MKNEILFYSTKFYERILNSHKTTAIKGFLSLFAALLLTSTLWATNVTLKVIDSNGDPIENVSISIFKWNVGGAGTIYTDSNGEATADLANYGSGYGYSFKATYAYSTSAYSQTISNDDEGDLIHTFQTSEAKIKVADCNGSPISGAVVTYSVPNAGGGTVGTTDGITGIVTKELFPGTYPFKAIINLTRQTINVNIAGTGIDQTFSPAQVNLNFADPITVWQNNIGGITVTPGTYMFPGTYNFKFGGSYTIPLTVNGCAGPALAGNVNILRLLDHNGNPLAGGTARGGNGNSHVQWFVSGSTDANGLLFDISNSNATTMSYEMKFNKTTSVITGQDVTANSIFEFQTELITMRLETCDGTPLDGGHVRWGHGASYGTSHFVGGNTGASATGETNAEFFPGTYSFEMGYNSTTNVKSSYNFPADGNTLVWQTTAVTLLYSGPISYGGASGDSRFFNKPTMELLSGGTYNFHFRNGYHTPITIEDGCEMTKSAVVLKLLNSTGGGIAGGTATYYKSGWQNVPGATDTNGNLFTLIDEPLGNTPFKMFYAGSSNQKSQDVSLNSVVIFQTVLATMKLLDSGNNPLASSDAQYYASGWKQFGNGGTETSMELLPNNYPFRVFYGGKSQQKSQDVGADPVVIFQTVLVTMKLLKSDMTTELTSDDAQYYSSGWKTFGNGATTTTMELLPGNYPFRVFYGGKASQKSQDVGGDPVVVFNTIIVTMKLLKSDMITELPSDDAQYYSSGWKTFGNGITSTTMELLPGNYPFRVFYGGKASQKSQDVGGDPVVVFNTIMVTMKLLDNSNNEIASDDAQYYSSGWKTFGAGATTTTMELLPGNYPFRVYLNGASLQKSQDVGTDPVVIFTGTSVQFQYTGAITYYASGWKNYSSPTNLLPNNYPFRFYDAAHSKFIQITLSIGGSEYIKSAAYARLRTSTGSGIAGANAKYYQSGWKDFETSTNSNGATLAIMDGHVGSIAFKMFHGGGALQKNQNIATDSQVEFQTELVAMELKTSVDATLNSSNAQYYASGWKTFGNGVTPTSMELLPGNYPFRVFYAGASLQKSQNISSGNSPVLFNTVMVSMELKSSVDATLNSSNAQYYASGWKTFGNGVTSTSMELLPLSYPFRVFYEGGVNQKSQNVGGDPAVEFKTTLMTVRLQDDVTKVGIDGGDVTYYASGWKNFGTTGTSDEGECEKELLSGTIPFKMNYSGESKQKNGTIAGLSSALTFSWDGGILALQSNNSSDIEMTKNDTPASTDNYSLTDGNFNLPTQENKVIQLNNNYPNPFNQSTTINFNLLEDKNVSLIIYDLNGKQVKILLNETKDSGTHQVEWNGDNDAGIQVPAGMYYYRIQSGNFVQTKSMIRIR